MSEEAPRYVPYVMVITDFSTIAAGATASTSPDIGIGPYPFVWEKLMIYSSGTSDDVDIDEIRDVAASINFLKESTHINALREASDDSRNDWKLSRPHEFSKHSAIHVQVTNNDAVNAASLELAFHGYLIM